MGGLGWNTDDHRETWRQPRPCKNPSDVSCTQLNDRVPNINTDKRSLGRIEFNYASEIESETVLAGGFKASYRRGKNGRAGAAGPVLKIAFAGVQESGPRLSKDAYFLKTLSDFHSKQSFNQVPIIEGVRL